MTINTKAVVIRSHILNGTDRRLTLYTERRGKLEVIAKGLQKSTSKLVAHLEPLTSTEAFIIEGRRRLIVAGSVVSNRYSLLKRDLSRIYAGGLVMRLVDLMTPIESREQVVFKLIEDTLEVLNDQSIKNEYLNLIPHLFAWKLLAISGYGPELQKCVRCSRKSILTEVRLHPRQGGTIHLTCLKDASSEILPISASTVKGLHYMINAPISDGCKLRSAGAVFAEMKKIIEVLVEERFEIGRNSRFWAVVS